MRLIRRIAVAGVLLAAFSAPAFAEVQQRTNPDAATIADFKKRVDDYVALHKKLEDTLPHLPKDANPTQLDQHQRALQKLMQTNRAEAKQGDKPADPEEPRGLKLRTPAAFKNGSKEPFHSLCAGCGTTRPDWARAEAIAVSTAFRSGEAPRLNGSTSNPRPLVVRTIGAKTSFPLTR